MVILGACSCAADDESFGTEASIRSPVRSREDVTSHARELVCR
jgi:hypothetical protein